jgi:peroxiredoxin
MSLPSPGPTLGALAPDFALPNAAGETVTLADYRGRAPVVLAFLRSRT